MRDEPAQFRAERLRYWLEKADAALRLEGMAAAAAVAVDALAEGIEHAALLNLVATTHYGRGRFDEAAELLTRARALDPDDPHVLNTLGVTLQALGRGDDALQAYDAALEVEPGMAAAHFNRGTLLQELNKIAEARAAFERAAALDAGYVEPLASLAWLAALAGDAMAAQAQAERALKLAPANVMARMALASVALQQGNLSAAAAHLTPLLQDSSLTPTNRSIVLGLAGDLWDVSNRPMEAFEAYRLSNAALRGVYAARFEAPGTETPLDRARRLAAWFEAADPAPWRQAPPVRRPAADPRAHVFLVGFPRSGTTLLENVLAAHPDVVSLEEKDSLAAASAIYLSSNSALDRLAQIDAREADRLRENYWAFVRSFGVEPQGRVFIDKMPLVSVLLPVVAKLFPSARILFARRDPRDVVLSCFRRRFGMNASMYQLLTLDGAAAFYDAVMRLAAVYRDRLPLPQHVVRHESLVDDFEGTGRGACEFIGLDWTSEMLDFAVKARTRGISTPSSSQVVRGLNREGQGVWRRYAAQIAPVLPRLDPWVREFGYESG